MNLTTTYLGLKLRTPLVPSASPLSEDIDNIKRMEDAGASAVVFYSLFEEQLRQDRLELHYHLDQGTESYRRGADLFSRAGGIQGRAGGISRAHREGESGRGIPDHRQPEWLDLRRLDRIRAADRAGRRRRAGAEHLLAPDRSGPHRRGRRRELPHILAAVKAQVKIPVAVKLSPFFTNFAHMAKRLDRRGANGLVLFNRFYQPDIELETLEVKPNILLSTPMAMRVPLRWIAILLRPHRRQPGGHQRHPSRDRRAEDAHGRRRCDDALLGPAPAWHRAHRRDRARHARMDGRTRIRIGRATQRQHEPEELPRPGAFERAQYMRALQTYPVSDG